MTDETRWQQGFYAKVDPIIMKDPLASLLGAIAPDGVIVYRFEDAVKLAGHSCTSVAAAYRMTALALASLYPGETPIRGEVDVTVPGSQHEGALGPMAQVISLITGAAPDTGFRGLAGHFRRYQRLRFQPAGDGKFVFRRTDTGKEVRIRPRTDLIPQDNRMRALMPRLLGGTHSQAESDEFVALWQGNVRRVLQDEIPGLFEISQEPS